MKKLIFALFSVCILFTSCHALVEDEFPDFAKVPVINGLLQADSTFRVQVSLTSNLTDTAPTYVSNARVIIESTVATPDTLAYTEKGWYVSARTVKVGASYTCRAEIPGYNKVSASTTIPYPSKIDSLIFTKNAGRNEEALEISSVEFSIKNNIETKSFWEVKLKSKHNSLVYDNESNEFHDYISEIDESIFIQAEQDSVMLSEPNPLYVFSNFKMKTNKHWIKFYYNENNISYNTNDTLFVELRNIDESFYKYRKQFYIYYTSKQINIGKITSYYPLFSNITNGLGLFTGMSVSRKIILPTILK